MELDGNVLRPDSEFAERLALGVIGPLSQEICGSAWPFAPFLSIREGAYSIPEQTVRELDRWYGELRQRLDRAHAWAGENRELDCEVKLHRTSCCLSSVYAALRLLLTKEFHTGPHNSWPNEATLESLVEGGVMALDEIGKCLVPTLAWAQNFWADRVTPAHPGFASTNRPSWPIPGLADSFICAIAETRERQANASS